MQVLVFSSKFKWNFVGILDCGFCKLSLILAMGIFSSFLIFWVLQSITLYCFFFAIKARACLVLQWVGGNAASSHIGLIWWTFWNEAPKFVQQHTLLLFFLKKKNYIKMKLKFVWNSSIIELTLFTSCVKGAIKSG